MASATSDPFTLTDTSAERPALFDQPADVDAERGLLGALLVLNDKFDSIADFLLPEHFFDPIHGRIFEGMSELFRMGRGIDPLTLNPRLQGDEAYAAMGGLGYLTQLVSDLPSATAALDYAHSIFECAIKRGLVRAGAEISHRARERPQSLSAKEQIEEAEKALFELASTGRVEKGFVPFKVALKQSIDMAELALKKESGLSGISTGIVPLDDHLGGLQNSDLVILAGRPGMGKTALATTIAFNVADRYVSRDGQEGARVAFFSLEMSSEQLATRIISQRIGVSSSHIRRGNIDEAQFENLVEVTSQIETLPLFIDDTGGISIAAIAARARRLVRTEQIGLIVIDYLQLVSPSGRRRNDNRVQEITEITQNLKALAKELNLPIIALSQLSRAVEGREDKRPQLSDLRESGSIEQDADVVMFVFREAYYHRQKMPATKDDSFDQWEAKLEEIDHLAEIILAKHRHGPVGKVDLFFNAPFTVFSGQAPKHYRDAD